MDLTGQQIGGYVAKRLLGAGGAGAVYLCEHTLIDRKVAVKVLHEEQALDPTEVQRFFKEARAAAEIGHPNIIVIIDAGHVATPKGNQAFIMMEALDGESLDKRLRAGPLALDEIRHILAQCVSALIATHGKGIIHRDLKPANLFLCRQQFDPMFVKLLDFGIAKLTTPDATGNKTQIGMVLGTPHYMSPEQCDGHGAIDHRSDVYSLGVMLYEMLTATLPFDGDIGQILLAHINQTPEPPSVRNPQVPPAWEALCLRMLERAKEDRPQSMAEVALALQDLERHAEIYAADQVRRATSNRSGHTRIMPAPDRSDDGVPRPIADAGSRPTVRGHLDDLSGAAPVAHRGHDDRSGPVAHRGHDDRSGPVAHRGHDDRSGPVARRGHPTPPGGFAAPIGGFSAPAQVVVPPVDPGEVIAHCGALATERQHRRFVDTLLAQPRGQWIDVVALCSYAHVPPPPPGIAVEVAWLDHPRADRASVVFFAPATLWSAVLLV